jgi:DNA polymerase-3 subunit epsilon
MNENKKFLLVSVLVPFLTVVYSGIVLFFFWKSTSIEEQQSVIHLVKPEYFFILFSPLILVLYIYINTIYKLWIKPLSRLKEEIILIQNANPSHRISILASKQVNSIIGLINEGADKFEKLGANVEKKIDIARKLVEEEKNILAAFISELSEGVIICHNDGRILLFNKQAKRFLSGDTNSQAMPSQNFLGLGRSIFGIIDKNIVVHAIDTINSKLNTLEDNVASTFVIVGRFNKQLRVEAVPVLNADRMMTGFIFIMVDITTQLFADQQIYVMLQNLTKKLRASSGGIRAAVETILQFPEMKNEQREMFHEIVHKEALNLSETIENTQKEYASYINSKWPLVHILADDIANSFKQKAISKLSMTVEFLNNSRKIWIKADSYSLIITLLFIADRLKTELEITAVFCSTYLNDKFVHFDMGWQGEPVKIEKLKQWETMILMVENEGIPLTLKEVTGHHDAEIIPFTPTSPNDFNNSKTIQGINAGIRIFIPAAPLPRIELTEKTATSIIPDQRPEFYDFDIFNRPDINPEIENTLLKELSYTVFDTETTGLNPSGGDEIISIGAVRIVNQKLLHDDIYEQLIDPVRSLPESSIKIHGIQPEMLKNQPIIDNVLPVFNHFSEETVLVAHNAAFDMAMLKAKESSTGVIFTNAVLDTLLLSAVVHPEQQSHNIEAITKRLGINVVGRHTAVGDALTTAEMFLKLIPLLEEMGIHTLKQAMEASKKTYYARIEY